ncbi:hypothetical protein A3K73_05995 [Candidatus Pacearchaeota archaeon RBG_13_36_9]|nr:MAG: hypothetical protein A3K73_05995 [Candidatus Pacearchaeota archaeon RBG_13_36_9]
MKKNVIYIAIALISIVFLASLVFALSQKAQVSGCKANCTSISRNETKICNEDYKACRTECREEKKACLDETQQKFHSCLGNCSSRWCSRDCSKQRIIERKECGKSECLLDCRNIRDNCTESAKANFSACKDLCELSPFEISEEDCENASGFFYKLCNGPYFDIVCSKESYCICDGKTNYTCPENYTCNKDIEEFLPRKAQAPEVYKDLLGNDLGNIGICKKTG